MGMAPLSHREGRSTCSVLATPVPRNISFAPNTLSFPKERVPPATHGSVGPHFAARCGVHRNARIPELMLTPGGPVLTPVGRELA
jgi:hypothetical protein